jgi:hypothetical protein
LVRGDLSPLLRQGFDPAFIEEQIRIQRIGCDRSQPTKALTGQRTPKFRGDLSPPAAPALSRFYARFPSVIHTYPDRAVP